MRISPPEKFAYALLDAYKNRDLTALLMAICQNSMFDLLRNSFLAPFRFNADGQENPVFLTDEKGNFLREREVHVSDRDYDRFRRIYREKPGVKMYLAYGYRKRHAYDEATMEVEEYKMGEHIGVLLVYELPDSVREKKRRHSLCGCMGYHDGNSEEASKSLCILWAGFCGGWWKTL